MVVLDHRAGIYVPKTRKGQDRLALAVLADVQGGASAFDVFGGYKRQDGQMEYEPSTFVFMHYGDSDPSEPIATALGNLAANLFAMGEESVALEIDGAMVLLFADDQEQQSIADLLLAEVMR